jgi:hypothetical protein
MEFVGFAAGVGAAFEAVLKLPVQLGIAPAVERGVVLRSAGTVVTGFGAEIVGGGRSTGTVVTGFAAGTVGGGASLASSDLVAIATRFDC